MEAIGSGLVMIIDGHDIRHSNIADIPDGCPISIESLKVHFLRKKRIPAKRKKFIPEVSENAVVKKQVDVEVVNLLLPAGNSFFFQPGSTEIFRVTSQLNLSAVADL